MINKLCGESVVLSPEKIECIDPEIRDVVIDLNGKGYHTSMSCAGHRSPSTTDATRGFLSFIEPWDVDGIADVLESHNLGNIRIGYSKIDPRDIPVYLLATFDPIGRQREVWNPIERKDRIKDSKSLFYDALDDTEFEPQPEPDEY